MNPKRPVKVIGLMVLAIIGVMSVHASAAQANYVLLLNGASVSLLSLTLEYLHIDLEDEGGLRLLCTGGTGTLHLVVIGGVMVSSTSNETFTGCVWYLAEKTCTIKDGVAGQVKAKGTGTVSMSASGYTATATSAELATVFTEGAFCTIPEEEVISGTASVTISTASAEANSKVKTGTLKADSLKLGNSKVTKLVGQVHIKDADPNATFAIHL